MRVAICYPPLKSEKGVALLTQNRQFQWFSRPTYIFPVVPATAATMMKKDGHDVLFLDGIAGELSDDEFEARLAAFRPDYVVLETKTPVVKRHWRWIDSHRGAGFRTVLVGDHVTAMPDESMENCPVDYILTGGDWDFLLRNLVASGGDASKYEPGIWYREGAEVRNTGRFRLDHDLNSAPWIDRDLVNWRLYSEKNGNFRRTPGTYIMSGRDCWHAKCTFCSWTTLYPTYRTRDPVDVVDEIEMLVEKYSVKEIMDDSGSLPVGKWLETFCGELIRRGLPKKLRIDCNMRFGRLTFDDYVLMRKAGFRLVLFGVESANQATLDRFVKALKVEDVEKGCEWAHKAGLDVHLTFMFGHAWEGPEEVANTVRFARRLLANGWASTLQCTLTIPYPGTPLFRELRENDGLATLDWDEYDMRRAITKTPLVSEDEIKRAIREVYKGFLQPRALFHRLTTTRNLFDFSFYYRGLRSLLGHLLDFSSKRLSFAAACLLLAGCWTFEQCEYPKTELSPAKEGRDVSVRLSGFEASVTSYDSAYSYTTVMEPHPYRDRYGRYSPSWGMSTYRTETLVPRTSPTTVFLDRATEEMEKAGFVLRAPNPRFSVEVKFSGPFSEDGDSASMFCWTLFTLFTADRGIQNWSAKLKIYDLASGKLLMESTYYERYQATVWGPVPFTAIMGTDATTPGKMQGWCLSALTDRAIADATAFLADK